MYLEKVKIYSPWIVLVFCFVTIWYQYEQINGLQNRKKRSSPNSLTGYDSENDGETILLPIFAQISKKNIRKVCMEHFQTMKSMKFYREASRVTKAPSSKKQLTRKCVVETNFGQPQLVGERNNKEGCAYLDGIHWHVCEMSHGYTILSFKGNRQLNTSTARAVQFLPYPFDGTDNTVHNKTMYYSEHARLVAYNFRDESSQTLNLRTSMDPLYANSTSRMDIQADEHGIWVLYRRPDETILSVSRLNVKNLEIVANWTLPSIDTSKICNTFIKCAILHSVGCDGVVKPIYDFYSHIYIQGRETKWEGLQQPIASVQYDPNSKSIAIFANSKIFKVSVHHPNLKMQ